MQLMRIQTQRAAALRLGPAAEAALREPLLAQPKALAVIDETLEGVAPARAEDKERAPQRVAGQRLAAERGQPVDAFAEIDRLDCQKNPPVRGNLDHERWRKNNGTRGRRSLGLASGSRRLKRAPEA